MHVYILDLIFLIVEQSSSHSASEYYSIFNCKMGIKKLTLSILYNIDRLEQQKHWQGIEM